jgi:methyl-accepting chemotaxis protein
MLSRLGKFPQSVRKTLTQKQDKDRYTKVKPMIRFYADTTRKRGFVMKQKNAVKQIFIGFGAMVLLITILATWAALSIGSLTGDAEEVIGGNKLKAEMEEREIDHLLWAASLCQTFSDKTKTAITVETDPHKCAFGKWYYGEGRKEAEKMLPVLKEVLAKIEEPHNHLHTSAKEIADVFVQVDTSLGSFLRDMKIAHIEWDSRVKDVVISSNIAGLNNVEMDATKCQLGKWLASEDRSKLVAEYPALSSILERMEIDHSRLHNSAKEISTMLTAGETAKAQTYYQSMVKMHVKNVVSKLDELIDWHQKSEDGYRQAEMIFVDKTLPALHDVQKNLHAVVDTVNDNVLTDEGMLNNARMAQLVIIVLGVISFALGSVAAVLIGLSIRRNLKRVIESLTTSSMEISSASSQVASGSEILASETSQQAASLQEISSNLQEMNSMIKMTSNNTCEADKLADEAQDSAEKGSDSMQKMSDAISRIRNSADETAKIVKTIDEIAFQTNLLALNAAVEAARAGDAGKGFAVVAEEVRNLAQRSAEAARTTASLIDESIENAKNGVTVNDDAVASLSDIVEKVKQINGLVGEISNASNQQATGMDDLSKAVMQMDGIVQNNASNAEESASAAEEMNAQATELQSIVRQLAALCGAETNGLITTGKNNKDESRILVNQTKPKQLRETALELTEEDF